MRRLLQIELIKVRTYKAFWVVLGIYSLILFLFSGAVGKMEPIHADPTETVFSFPEVWQNLAYMASYLNLLLGILIIMLICNEYTFKTFRQNVIDGLSRDEAVMAKFILIGAIALGCIAFIFVYGLTRGLIAGHFNHSGEIFGKMSCLLRLFVQMFGYMSIAAVLAFVIRRSALSIMAFLIYAVALERIISFRLPDQIDRYLPMNVLSELIPNPVQMQLNFPGESQSISGDLALILAVVYSLVCFTAARTLMQKSNL